MSKMRNEKMPAWRPPVKETPRIPKGGRPAHAAAKQRELEAWRRKLDQEWERQQQERKELDDQKARVRSLLNEVEAITARHEREVGRTMTQKPRLRGAESA